MKSDANKSMFDANDFPKVKGLVLEMLQNLPLILTTSIQAKTNFIPGKGEKYLTTIKKTKENIYEASIITEKNIKTTKLRGFDHELLEKSNKMKNMILLKAPIGQGRKAVNHKGKLDKTEIFDITSWPNSCKTDKNQSPININGIYEPLAVGIKMNYSLPKGKLFFLNDGYKLILRADFGKIFYGIHEYTAREIHFHSPSEHTFGKDEKRSPLEMQIINQDIFGNLLAVSVHFNLSNLENEFLKELGFGYDNPLFAMRLRNSETIQLKPSAKLNIGKFINKIEHYVHYFGSITTPPCNSNVQWFVLLEKLHITQRQLEYFPVLFGMDSDIRGLQPLGERKLDIN